VVVIEIGVGTTSVDKIDILRIDSSSTSDESKLRSEWKINKSKSDIYSKELKSKKPVTNKAILPYEPKEIIIFTTDWCPRCYEAKAFFDQNGIGYTEYDIEKSEIGKQMYDVYGVKGVPLVVIDKAQFLGFRPQAMIAELRKYEKYR
jgi:glutaredoxin